ncbi:gluconokinase [Niallia oryzisoli]|uniref:gluconokinase n=1 Tax=Niallia oryzisoli TaxID=1737571 RepID=UPI00373515E2
MRDEYVIGLDIGTTSAKAVLFTTEGKVVLEAEQPNTTLYPHPGWVEQEPAAVERACMTVLKDIFSKSADKRGQILGIGISCAQHSLICVGENGEPLSNMLIWSDGRSSDLAEKLMHTQNGKEIFMETGTPIHPMSPFLKLLWMKENDYEPYHQAAYFMSFKEYLLFKWYGVRMVDHGMAASAGLLNLKTLDWSDRALDMTGVRREQLSKVIPPTEILTGMNPQLANEIGIPDGLPMVIGSGDAPLANLGSGAIQPGELNISLGTSGALRQFTKGFPINESAETYTYSFNTEYSIIGGPTNNGGNALQWAMELFHFEGSFNEFLDGAGNIKVGADGIIFHPYLSGERAPLWNRRSRGNLYGLTIEHSRDHIVRAILEGITFNLYQIGISLEKVAGKPDKITVNGGLTRSEVWLQILADVFGQDIYVSETHQNAAWGAAWTALVAIGKASSFSAIKDSLPTERVVKTNIENHELYQEIFMKYLKIGENVQEFFH